MAAQKAAEMTPLLVLALLLRPAFTSPLTYDTERTPHSRPFILRLMPRRETFQTDEEEVVDSPYRGVPAFYEESPQYRFTPPYATYYERPLSYERRTDPVEDLEEEMRQDEWWDGQGDGDFLRNLILAQRYRDDSMEDVHRGADKAVRELESLAGKRSEVTPTSIPVGQKEVALPASPPRRPAIKHSEERSVYAVIEKLLQESSPRHQKRFVSNEDSMLEQLKQLKRA